MITYHFGGKYTPNKPGSMNLTLTPLHVHCRLQRAKFYWWDSPTRGWQIGKSCPMNHSEQGKHANISEFFGYLSGFINHSNWTSMGPSLNSMGDWGRALAYGSLGHGLGIWNVGRPGPANLGSLRRLESEPSLNLGREKSLGLLAGLLHYPLVNVYITMELITMLFMGKLIISTGPWLPVRYAMT